MAFLRTKEIIGADKIGRKRTTHRFVYECEECHNEYELSRRKLNSRFCKKACQRASKSWQDRINETCKKRYGGRGNASKQLRQKGVDTCLEKYGVDHPWKHPDIHEKCFDTMEERHGFRGFLGSDRFRETMQELYGATHPMHVDAIKEKLKETNLKNFGHEHALQDPGLMEKMKATCLERHGCEYGFQTDECKVNNRSEEANKKRHQTMKDGGLLMISHVENSFFDWLTTKFENIERQIRINNWSIDFYVHDVKAYVQFDGVYWHGLDRSYDVLHEKRKITYDKDRKQDIWFKENGLVLVRITDIEFLAAQKKNDFDEIAKKLGG